MVACSCNSSQTVSSSITLMRRTAHELNSVSCLRARLLLGGDVAECKDVQKKIAVQVR